jgi:hypothetical protein
MKVHQIDETSGSEEGEYVLTVQTNDSREDIKAIDKEIFPKKIFATMILLPHCQMFHLFGVPSFVCTVETYPSSSLPDVSSIWCTFICLYC